MAWATSLWTPRVEYAVPRVEGRRGLRSLAFSSSDPWSADNTAEQIVTYPDDPFLVTLAQHAESDAALGVLEQVPPLRLHQLRYP